MRVFNRALRASAAITGLLLVVAVGLAAQIPGQNVNIVSKDPFLQKQNEPSGAVGTLNPCHLLIGANDYRTVNIPGEPGDLGDREVGDAWVGVYQSTDCGQTWLAALMPGYPQDNTPEGMASPAKGLAAGADPTVKAGLAGFYAYSFIAFNRNSNIGKLLLARFIDPNNSQVNASGVTSGDPLQVPIEKWPIQYVGPTLLVDGTAGQFLDKPHMTVSPGVGTCDLPYREPNPAVPGAFVTKTRTVPATVVHLVWTTFINNAVDGKTVTRVNYNRSSNCGTSLDGPTKKLSETFKVNQGGSIAISPINGDIFVAWRSFDLDVTNNQTFQNSQILFAKSTDGGKSFTPPTPVTGLSPSPTVPPTNFFFDQNTSTNPPRFRTIAYPTTAFDHNGKFYLAVSVRSGNAQRSARVRYTTTMDGVEWTPLAFVSDSTTPEHQIMPAFTYASGKLQAVWYDFIDDASQVFQQDVHDGHVFAPGPLGSHVRHTVDVRGAEGTVGPSGVTFSTYGVLQVPGVHPKISQYLHGTYTLGSNNQTPWIQSNRVNLKLYCGGECPFLGDYIDVAGLPFVPQPGATADSAPTWVFNGPATAGAFSRDFHAAWTDNRDALVDSPGSGLDGSGALVPYTAPSSGSCNAQTTNSRNANIYTSRMTPGISLLLPVNAKPVDLTVAIRSFPIVIQNGTDAAQTVHVTIASPPAGATASFAQSDASQNSIDVFVPSRSSAARTIFVTSSSSKFPRIQVLATAGPTLNASVVINPDATNPLLFGALATGETHEPVVANPDLDNPDLDNPDLDNPDLDNPDLDNVQVENPDLDNPDLDNPDLDNPDLDNPDLDNPDLDNATITDTTYEISNTGIDASVFQIDVDITGKKTDPYNFQLIARRVYKLPSAKGCDTTKKTGVNQVLFNITNPDTAEGVFRPANDPDKKNATVLLMPGETIKLTLRVKPKDAKTPRFCPFADGPCTAKMKTHTVAIKVKAQVKDAGQAAPKEVKFVKQ